MHTREALRKKLAQSHYPSAVLILALAITLAAAAAFLIYVQWQQTTDLPSLAP
jgi:hypothetical protein